MFVDLKNSNLGWERKSPLVPLYERGKLVSPPFVKGGWGDFYASLPLAEMGQKPSSLPFLAARK